MRWTIHPLGGAYLSKTKEFNSLRSAAEHVRDLPGNCEFQEIRAMELDELTDREKAAFALFTDGKFVLS